VSRWFRWYEGTTEDGKFRVTARNANVTVASVMGVWACLLEDASHPDHRGFATKGPDYYAAILDLGVEEIISILEEMEGADLVRSENENITITRWKERQFETDTKDSTNADRQRLWRQKHQSTEHITSRNGSVTATKRPDTDTDTDTDKKVFRPVAKATRPEPTESFERFKQAYPRRQPGGSNPWPPARKLFEEAVRRGAEPDRIISAITAGVGYDREKVGTEYIPQAVKWLRDRRWEDWTPPADTRTPPEEGLPSDEELRKRYANHGHDQESNGQGVFREGGSTYSEAPLEREWGADCAHDPPRTTRIRSLGSVLCSSGLDARGHANGSSGPEAGSDDADAMARMVR
jgi:hypothetical protein